MAAGGSTKAILAAMFANAGIAIAKFVAYLVTGAASMLAESIHSVADTTNQALLLLGSRKAQRAASDIHQFGYGRERYFWAFVVSLVLFTLGGLFALYEGYQKLADPHEITSVGWAIGVLIFGIFLEGYSFGVAIGESRKVKGDRSWYEFIRTSRTPELPVVLLEDAGAMIGLVLALIGVGAAAITGNPLWDALGTMAIGTLLVIIALTLTVEMKSLLIGESVTVQDRKKIDATLAGIPSVRRVIDLRTLHLGPEEILIAAKIEFDRSLSVAGLSDEIDDAERGLREAIPGRHRIYIEPDLYEGDYPDASVSSDHDDETKH
ncbi:MAG: cation diffusion facilitator family transporter [Acidimicrobiia bacterium]|nr:cation diffusion facilitator family transporter [Acidimicrobiia bacterium]